LTADESYLLNEGCTKFCTIHSSLVGSVVAFRPLFSSFPHFSNVAFTSTFSIYSFDLIKRAPTSCSK
jgi:hypothetical protein